MRENINNQIEFKKSYDTMSLFKEINANMIATDSKYNMAAWSHNTVMLAAVGFFVKDNFYYHQNSWALLGLLSLFSLQIFYTMSSLQGWKNVYLDRMRDIWAPFVKNMSVEERLMLPKWLLGIRRNFASGTDISLLFGPSVSSVIWGWLFWIKILDSGFSPRDKVILLQGYTIFFGLLLWGAISKFVKR